MKIKDWLKKILGRGEDYATPQQSSHCFESQDERAKHWAQIGTRVTGAHVIETSRHHP